VAQVVEADLGTVGAGEQGAIFPEERARWRHVATLQGREHKVVLNPPGRTFPYGIALLPLFSERG